MVPAQFPPTYVLYVGSAVVGVIAWTRSLRARQRGFTVLLGLWYATGAGIGLAWLGADAAPLAFVVGPAALALGAMLLRASWRAPSRARTIALGVLLHGCAAAAWNGLLASDPDAMWGAFVALGASIIMLAAAGVALRDEHRVHVEELRASLPATLPTARARVRAHTT